MTAQRQMSVFRILLGYHTRHNRRQQHQTRPVIPKYGTAMTQFPIPTNTLADAVVSRFLRIAASGYIPARWFLPNLLPEDQRSAKTGPMHIELVSHCWHYSHLLVHQLSSLVSFPPKVAKVTMTVFFCEDDAPTARLLKFFGNIEITGITWNWQALPRQALFRRSIGRNIAAKNTSADWIWFTDCDLLFRDNCLDALNQALQGRTDALVYPKIERCTTLLTKDDPLLNADTAEPQVIELDTRQFIEFKRSRATGPLQITHGDVARSCGYCDCLSHYQRPSETWCKAYEDRAFRWLLRTQGIPIDLPGVYRIRHLVKGRYTGSKTMSNLRGFIRRITSR